MYLLLVDANFKWLKVYDMHMSTTSQQTISVLYIYFFHLQITFAVGIQKWSSILSSDFTEFMKKNGVKNTTGVHPATIFK